VLNKITYSNLKQRLVLSGSFNPLHDGHLEMMHFAKQRYTDLKPIFELSLHNADKGGVTTEAIEKRIEQFTSRNLDLALT
jgi:nicotinic acid mononucleotide adenylyltransferase